jgi:hypothetical protein
MSGHPGGKVAIFDPPPALEEIDPNQSKPATLSHVPPRVIAGAESEVMLIHWIDPNQSSLKERVRCCRMR